MMITLKNDFHNTETRVRVADRQHGPWHLSASQTARARRALCGVTGCTCGSVRGPQRAPDGHRLLVIEDIDRASRPTMLIEITD